MPAAIRRPASLVSDRAMTQNVISPGRNVATPAARLISSHWGGRIDETETRFCCSMSASRSAYSNAVSAWRCTPTPWVRNTLLGNGNIVPSTSPDADAKTLVAPAFFPCLIPQQACDTQVRRLGENQADSGQDADPPARATYRREACVIRSLSRWLRCYQFQHEAQFYVRNSSPPCVQGFVRGPGCSPHGRGFFFDS